MEKEEITSDIHSLAQYIIDCSPVGCLFVGEKIANQLKEHYPEIKIEKYIYKGE